jgi:hypothetical protein
LQRHFFCHPYAKIRVFSSLRMSESLFLCHVFQHVISLNISHSPLGNYLSVILHHCIILTKVRQSITVPFTTHRLITIDMHPTNSYKHLFDHTICYNLSPFTCMLSVLERRRLYERFVYIYIYNMQYMYIQEPG